MWKVFPKLGLLKLLLAIFSALFLSALILLMGTNGGELSWNNFGDSFKLSTPITLIFIVVIFVIGKWGWLLFWKLPFLGALRSEERRVGKVCGDGRARLWQHK